MSQVLATVSREPPDRPVRRVAARAYAQALASAVRRVPAGYRVSRSA
ncbi:MAG: hypothetical protein ACO1OK_13240 [Devosia sp.]